jgi:peptidoglycan/LPS O-acetylase OafA/YrhL
MKLLFTRRAPIEDSNLEAINGIRCITLGFIVLGNTYFYILKGPLENLTIIQEWMTNVAFCIVISAELASDVFFWISAFLATYFLLNKMLDNDGNVGSNMRIILNRYMRLFPLYAYALFFFWLFIPLFGGDGPMFFMYNQVN